MIDREKKMVRERRGSREYRERNRAKGIPPSHTIDRAIAGILLADVLRPADGSVDSWRRAELERAIAKRCKTTETTDEQQHGVKDAIRQRIEFLLGPSAATASFDDFEAIGAKRYEK
tara:strand:- start:762 stop:1112 length:351 start_codon:yes stop_codon:yes gene_type:complete